MTISDAHITPLTKYYIQYLREYSLAIYNYGYLRIADIVCLVYGEKIAFMTSSYALILRSKSSHK